MDRKRISVLLIVFVLTGISCTSQTKQTHNKILLISFDGFRADYLSKTETPNFDVLVEGGVTSEGMIPVFPSKTFPNHYAIATGLYPENNGLVGNTMYDPDLDLMYRIGDREQVENPVWYQGEPIWNTVEKNGLKAGTMFWVGSEAPVQNMRPTFWKVYDGRVPNEARIDTVINWMTIDSPDQVDFATLYFSFTDSDGHRYGPESQEVVESIKEADKLVGYLISEMKSNDLWGKTDIIIVSDHGMYDLSQDRIIVLDDYINPDDITVVSSSPVLGMNVAPDKLENVYQALKTGEENYRVYKKEDIPERYHLKNHKRVTDLIMVADLGYFINTKDYFDRFPDRPTGATHGFDNRDKEMYAIFVAYGPDFKEGLKVKPFENIHVFELIANLLGIPSPGTDGNIDSVKVMLK